MGHEDLIIKLNAAKCKLCGSIVVSGSRHDSTTCKCGNLTVDGGTDYIRRVCKKPGSFEEMSIYDPNPPKEVEIENTGSNSTN